LAKLERYRLILERISDAVFLTDEMGNFTFISSNVLEIFGYSIPEVLALGKISELLGKNLFSPASLEASGELRNT
jgi:PAS domain S-box-containing protein